MKNVWIVLLLILVAVGAYLLGRRSTEPAPAVAPVAGVATAATAAPAAGAEPNAEGMGPDRAPATEPVRTYRGPDGRAHIISYDEKNPPDSNDPDQVRKALLSDMKFFPTNIERNYDLSAEDVQAMLAGRKPIPEFMLPPPGGPAKVK